MQLELPQCIKRTRLDRRSFILCQAHQHYLMRAIYIFLECLFVGTAALIFFCLLILYFCPFLHEDGCFFLYRRPSWACSSFDCVRLRASRRMTNCKYSSCLKKPFIRHRNHLINSRVDLSSCVLRHIIGIAGDGHVYIY